MRKLLVDKRDLDRIKSDANAYFLESSNKDMNPTEFVVMSYIYAVNLFFNRNGGDCIVEYDYIEYQDPDNDRIN